jgi:Domain of unknown function (DUF4390)
MMRSRIQKPCRWVVVAAAFMFVAVAHAAESLRITPTVRNDHVLVSFELTDAYTDSVRESIASGLRTTFTYQLELRTVVSIWMDRTIATAVVTASDQFDNLTRRHTLTRTVDGRVEDVLVSDNEKVVRQWLTMWSRLTLCETSKLDPSRDYYVRISARARPSGESLLGLARTISGQARFTFVR